MYLTVGALAVLAAVGGWLQFADVWTPVDTGSTRSRGPLAEASGTQEAIASVIAVVLGAAGIGVAWWIYAARRVPAPRPSRLLEQKF